jgi:hypothetical protein
VSLVLSLRDREVDALERKLRGDGDPDLAAVAEKLARRHDSEIDPIPGQLALEDYPEVFADAA